MNKTSMNTLICAALIPIASIATNPDEALNISTPEKKTQLSKEYAAQGILSPVKSSLVEIGAQEHHLRRLVFQNENEMKAHEMREAQLLAQQQEEQRKETEKRRQQIDALIKSREEERSQFKTLSEENRRLSGEVSKLTRDVSNKEKEYNDFVEQKKEAERQLSEEAAKKDKANQLVITTLDQKAKGFAQLAEKSLKESLDLKQQLQTKERELALSKEKEEALSADNEKLQAALQPRNKADGLQPPKKKDDSSGGADGKGKKEDGSPGGDSETDEKKGDSLRAAPKGQQPDPTLAPQQPAASEQKQSVEPSQEKKKNRFADVNIDITSLNDSQ